MKKLFSVLIFTFISFSSVAQYSESKVMGHALQAKMLQKIGLGLHVISEEDNKTVMMSKSGRYIIKGTVTDLWEGIQESKSIPSQYPLFPAQLNKDDFLLSFGDKEKTELVVYTSYSCLLCNDVLTQIFNDDVLSKYYVRVFMVYNNPTDKMAVDNVYCAKDSKTYFKSLFVEHLDVEVNEKCVKSQSDMNVHLANAQGIRALPSVYIANKNVVHLGILPKTLLN